MVAEKKKGKYIYYHCTGNKGKCPPTYVREEEVDRQFVESLKRIQVDQEILDCVVVALKQSHRDEKTYHEEKIASLHQKSRVIQERIDAMYLDKLDGKISQDFFDSKHEAWRREQAGILREIENYQNANRVYIEDGVQLIELAQNAANMYKKESVTTKRKILSFVYSNSSWSDDRLNPVFRNPFQLLAVTNDTYKKEQGTLREKSALRSVWLPKQDSNLRHGD